MFAKLDADFDALRKNYCKHNELYPPLQKALDALNKIAPGNTPCCMQMSHALNAAGVTIPKVVRPNRRVGDNPALAGGNGYYLLAVDELEDFLTMQAGKTDEFAGDKLSMAKIKMAILGRKGILVFRSGGFGTYGFHTELWTGNQIVQSHSISGNMNEAGCFKQPRVLFWETTGGAPVQPLPLWLRGWWELFDGNYYYYYYFADQPAAFYTKRKPSSPDMPPTSAQPLNYGSVAMGDHGPVLTWNSVDGGKTNTIETFTRLDWTSETDMNVTSNFYGPLYARKLSSIA